MNLNEIEINKIKKKLNASYDLVISNIQYGNKFSFDNKIYYVFKSVDDMKKAHEENILSERDIEELDIMDKNTRMKVDNFIIIRRK
tara:strand:- start:737 stop:994 length:258 start_codon:yes stop_codon:yes gene_type:complete